MLSTRSSTPETPKSRPIGRGEEVHASGMKTTARARALIAACIVAPLRPPRLLLLGLRLRCRYRRERKVCRNPADVKAKILAPSASGTGHQSRDPRRRIGAGTTESCLTPSASGSAGLPDNNLVSLVRDRDRRRIARPPPRDSIASPCARRDSRSSASQCTKVGAWYSLRTLRRTASSARRLRPSAGEATSGNRARCNTVRDIFN